MQSTLTKKTNAYQSVELISHPASGSIPRPQAASFVAGRLGVLAPGCRPAQPPETAHTALELSAEVPTAVVAGSGG